MFVKQLLPAFLAIGSAAGEFGSPWLLASESSTDTTV